MDLDLNFNILLFTLLLPLLGAALIGLVADLFADAFNTTIDRASRGIALAASVGTFVCSLIIAASFTVGDASIQLTESFDWIPSIGASLSLGVDGISLVLVLLTTLITPLVLWSSWDVTDRPRGYLAAFLALETTVLGVFLATDLLAVEPRDFAEPASPWNPRIVAGLLGSAVLVALMWLWGWRRSARP